MEVTCDVDEICTAVNRDDFVTIADNCLNVWKIQHVHSLLTRVGFVLVRSDVCDVAEYCDSQTPSHELVARHIGISSFSIMHV